MIVRFANLALRMCCLFSKLIFVIILGKSLNVDEFGYYGLISSSLVYLSGVIGLEFYTYSNKDLLRGECSVGKSLINQFAIFCVTLPFILFFILSFGFGESVAGRFFISFMLILVFEYISLELGRLLNILNLQVLSSVMLFIRSAMWMLPLSTYLYFDTDGVYGDLNFVLHIWLLMSAVSVICSYIALKIKNGFILSISLLDISWIVKGVRNSFPLFASSQATLLLFFLDRYFIKIFSSIDMVGVYSFYIGLINAMISVLESSLFVFFIPKTIMLYQSGKMDELNYEIKRLLMISLAVISILILISISVLDVIAGFVDKEIFYEYKRVFFFLLVCMLFRALSQIYHYAIYAANKNEYIFISSILSLIVFFIFFFISLIYFDAIYAVSLAIMFVAVFQFGTKYYIWKKLCGCN